VLMLPVSPKSKESFGIKGCWGHRYCNECIQAWIAIEISNGKHSISCPHPDCGNLISPEDTLRIEHTNNQANTPPGARQSVPSITTLRPEEYPLTTKHLHVFAMSHKERLLDFTTGVTEESVHKWVSDNCRVCPTCSVLTFRDGGCYSVNCPCGTTFNWETAEQVPVPDLPAAA
jgi:hypothetical protein